MPVRYSVVIVSYNCQADLNRCLQSLLSDDNDEKEIIVVDNASNDDTKTLIRQYPSAKAIFNKENNGFSKACNQGAELARGDFLIFLNPDTVVPKNWLRQMSKYFENPQVGAVGPLSNYVAGHQKYELHTQQNFLSLSHIDTFAEHLAGQNAQKGFKTKLLIGFCLMIRKDVFETLGRMDESLFLGNDDLDLSWRLTQANYLLVVASDTFVYHEGQKSFKTQPDTKTQMLVQKSTDALYRKLVNYYGSADKVPHPQTLWGIDWFKPSETVINEMKHPPLKKRMDSDFSWLFISGPDSSQEQTELSLGSLNQDTDQGIYILNQSNQPIRVESKRNVIKLDVPASVDFNDALEMGLNLIQTDWIFISLSGVEITPFLKLALPRLIELTESDWISFPVQERNKSGLQKGFFAFCCARGWLQSKLQKSRESNQSITQILLPILSGPGDIDDNTLPVLPYSGKTASTPNITPDKTDEKLNIGLYPTSLQPHLQSADYPHFSDIDISNAILYDGTAAQKNKCDLLIIRIKDSNLKDFQQIWPEISDSFPVLKKLIILYLPDGADDALEKAIRQLSDCCWMNRHRVVAQEIYSGVDAEDSENSPEKGWQLICEPRSPEVPRNKKVSIVILAYNQIAYTKKCIQSITAHTKQPYEFVLVDNGSQDGTGEYFHSIPGAKVILNSTNLGVAKGWNQGMKQAEGDYILILNNDVIATPHWLDNMLRLAESGASIGIVGPRTNNISGPQLIPDTNIRSESDIGDYADSWVEQNNLTAFEFERIVGFAMLIKRDVYEKVGFFDERFGKGNFEDDDYCLRARYHGFKLMVANDSFLFHFGSVSYRDSSVDWQNQMLTNQRKFQEKWMKGREALTDSVISPPNKNSEFSRAIERATSAYQANDLANARLHYKNAAEISPDSGEAHVGLGILAFHDAKFEEAISHFQTVLDINPSDQDAALNIMDCLERQQLDPRQLSAELTRLSALYPNQPVFNKAIKEKLGGISNAPAHWREHVEDLIRQKSYSKALDILENLLKSGNELAFCYNYLGIIAFECGDTAMAFDHFQKSIDINLLDEDILLNYHDAGIKLGNNSQVLGTLEKAFSYPGQTEHFDELKQCYQHLKAQSKEGSWDPEKAIATREMNIAGENLVREGMMPKAEEIFEEIIASDPANFRAMNNKGLLAWYKGDFKGAWEHFAKALSLNPGYSDALINAFDAALKLRNIDEFRNFLDKFLEVDPHNHQALDLLQSIVEKGKDIYDIINFESLDSGNVLLDKAMEQLNKNQLNEATLTFLDVVDQKPEWYAPYNGLGIIAYKKKMYREAFKLFEKAVELNPLDENSLMNLWSNAGVLGIETEVIDRLVAAVQMDPGLQQVQSALDAYST